MQRDDPDLTLVRRIAGGDKNALAELYTRHGLHVLNYLIRLLQDRHTAEEVLQNVMLAVWQQAGGFRGEGKARSWIFAIARRQAFKAQRGQVKALELDETLIAGGSDPQYAVEHKHQIETLRRAIHQLPVYEQQVLELVYYRGLSLAEAAGQLDIPVNTVKSRLHRARARLREHLSTQETNHA